MESFLKEKMEAAKNSWLKYVDLTITLIVKRPTRLCLVFRPKFALNVRTGAYHHLQQGPCTDVVE